MKKEVIITILVAILLIVGMVGYALYNNQKTKKPNNNENKTEILSFRIKKKIQ